MDHFDALNGAPHDPGHTAVFGANHLADRFPHEVDRLFTGVRDGHNALWRTEVVGAPPPPCTQVRGCCDACPANSTLAAKGPDPPPRLDWREYRTASNLPVVTPIVNQGHCGSCWAFSAVAQIETSWLLAGNPPVGGGSGALSVQRVLDCVYPLMSEHNADYPHYSPNCSGGGLVQEALEFGLNYGVPAASFDKYKCEGGCADGSMSCADPLPEPRPNSTAPSGTNSKSWITSCCGSGQTFLCGNGSHAPNMKGIMRAAANYGLLAINVNARNWVGYTSGIIKNHCEPVSMNHAVILAGYGTDTIDGESVDYWLIRNSWGEQWGEQGYGRLFRDNATNVCGFASNVYLASSNRTAQDGPIYIDECD